MARVPFEAWAPAFGVWATAKGKFVRLQVQDSGGRGHPHVMIVMRVERQGDRLRLVDKQGRPISIVDGQGLLDACIDLKYNSDLHSVSPYFFDIPIDEWPKSAPLVLVLLLYLQARGIGGRSRPLDTYRYEGKLPSASRHADANEVAGAVRHALKYDTVDDLRGGLIDGTLPSLRGGEDGPASQITLGVASCLYPADILEHMPDDEHATRGPADASLLALADLLGKPNAPTLLLLAGDQVYVDATAGLFDPKVADGRFRIPYERRAQSRGVQAVMQRLGLTVEMLLDDHEIQDNWAPNDPQDSGTSNDPQDSGTSNDPQDSGTSNDPQGKKRYTAIKLGKEAYFKYERALQRAPAKVWHHFYHKGFPFFIGDTRTERRGRNALNWRCAEIMSPEQFSELCDWLAACKHTLLPKFVLTSSALLPRRVMVKEYAASALYSEGWEGYPFSLYSLLKFACDNEIKGLIFMSGDDHLSNVVTAKITCCDDNRQCTLHSIHSSALYAPYPFANETPDNFLAHETFRFCDPKNAESKYTCEVAARFFPGDGFAVVSASNSEHWDASVRFFDSRGAQKTKDIPLDLGL
jgi:hypothetical protein